MEVRKSRIHGNIHDNYRQHPHLHPPPAVLARVPAPPRPAPSSGRRTGGGGSGGSGGVARSASGVPCRADVSGEGGLLRRVPGRRRSWRRLWEEGGGGKRGGRGGWFRWGAPFPPCAPRRRLVLQCTPLSLSFWCPGTAGDPRRAHSGIRRAPHGGGAAAIVEALVAAGGEQCCTRRTDGGRLVHVATARSTSARSVGFD